MNAKKIVSLILVICLAMAVGIGGTLAWLKDSTDTVTNTFVIGSIDIDLYEHKYIAESNSLNTSVEVRDASNNNYKIVPGNVMPKDPTVVVEANSEACYLFIKVVATDVEGLLDYAIDEGWTELSSGSGVYYREVAASDEAQPFDILVDNEVSVSEDLSKAEADAAITAGKNPSLKFTAYAAQQAHLTATEAWALFPQQ